MEGYSSIFFRHLGGRSAFRSKVLARDFKGINMIDSLFWKDVFVCWLNTANRTANTNQEASVLYLNDPICNNRIIRFKGEVIYLPTCLSRGIVTIDNMLSNGSILTLREFVNRFGEYPRSMLDYNVLRNALTRVLHKVQLHDQNVILCRGAIIGKQGRKCFYKFLISDSSLASPLCVGLWQRKFGISIGAEHWMMVHSLKESRLKALCWKILQNIYPTRINLSKMGLSDSENCKYCGLLDTIEHFFYFCTKVRPLWQTIKADILTHWNINVNINEQIVILGPIGLNSLGLSQLRKVNQIMAIGKMVISKFKYGHPRNIIEIYETECYLRKVWDG